MKLVFALTLVSCFYAVSSAASFTGNQLSANKRLPSLFGVLRGGGLFGGAKDEK
jgi:hypothetical protein